MSSQPKICFLGYGKLTEMAQAIVTRFDPSGSSVLLLDSKVDRLHQCIDEAVGKGYKVFIAGSANAAEFRRYSGEMLIELKLRPIDFAIAVKKALRQGKRPAVVQYCWSGVVKQSELSSLFEDPIEYIEYQTDEELIEKIRLSNADVLIGASRAKEAAEQLGKAFVFIYPGEEMIKEALNRAKAIVRALQREQRNNELIHAIISESTTGIIGFSEKREVLIMNEAAQRFTGLSAEQIRRSVLRQFITDQDFFSLLEKDRKSNTLIWNTGSKSIRVQLTKIERQGEVLGSLLLMDKPAESKDLSDLPDPVPFADLPTFKDAVCNSPAMKQTVSLAKLYGGKSNIPLVLTGEHGVGKYLLAQCIHSFFHTSDQEYVCMNCAAVLDEESARFFYGSHDGMGGANRGIIDFNTLGTLVLEDIWVASEKLQSCILWMLKGMSDCISHKENLNFSDFNVITIIPDDKWELCRQNLRSDLFLLLQSFIVKMPPLRERVEDIFPLFSLWLRSDPNLSHFGSRTLDVLKPLLTAYSWPGNISELRTVCRRYALLSAASGKLTPAGKQRLLIDCIGESSVFSDIIAQSKVKPPFTALDSQSLGALAEKLKTLLLYNNEQIADRLGLSRTSMWRKLQEIKE